MSDTPTDFLRAVILEVGGKAGAEGRSYVAQSPGKSVGLGKDCMQQQGVGRTEQGSEPGGYSKGTLTRERQQIRNELSARRGAIGWGAMGW